MTTITQQFLVSLHFQSFKKQLLEEEIQIIIQHWVRLSQIKLGWINDFDKIIANYKAVFIMFETFRSSSKLLSIFTGHTDYVWGIDYSIFDDRQFICSGSSDKTVCVWDIDTNKKIRSFNEHLGTVFCVKFSPYHYHNNHQNVICSSSMDKTIRFWDFKHNRQLQIFNEPGAICGIEFSSFNGGRYLCSGSFDKAVRLWDIETSKSLHIFSGHQDHVLCIDISPLKSNRNNIDKSNSIGVIGGDGYTICSGSADDTICIWDIETAKQL
ncbi:WD-40 repeat protein, partial [Reticulomyxa filosa]